MTDDWLMYGVLGFIILVCIVLFGLIVVSLVHVEPVSGVVARVWVSDDKVTQYVKSGNVTVPITTTSTHLLFTLEDGKIYIFASGDTQLLEQGVCVQFQARGIFDRPAAENMARCQR